VDSDLAINSFAWWTSSAPQRGFRGFQLIVVGRMSRTSILINLIFLHAMSHHPHSVQRGSPDERNIRIRLEIIARLTEASNKKRDPPPHPSRASLLFRYRRYRAVVPLHSAITAEAQGNTRALITPLSGDKCRQMKISGSIARAFDSTLTRRDASRRHTLCYS